MSICLVPHRCVTRAYTLIELMIVIVVLGLSGALLVPHLAYKDGLSTQAVVRMIISDMNFAQSDALANQEFRRVHFYADGSGYCIFRVTEATFNDPFNALTADYIDDPLGVVRGPNALGAFYIVNFAAKSRFEDISINSVDFDGGNRHITYDALGGTVTAGNAPGIGGRIQIQAEDMIYEIAFSPFTGKMTVARIQ